MEGGGSGCLLIFSTFRMGASLCKVGANSRLGAHLNKYSVCFYQIHILQRELAAVDGYDAYFTRFR